jgi:hypothetical protein
MRSVDDYLQKAAEFEQLAAESGLESLRKRYADVAACYRLLAEERKSLIEQGVIEEIRPK